MPLSNWFGLSLKGTLMQIMPLSLSLYMKIICRRFYCEKFVYKDTEIIEYVKNYPSF